MNEAMPGALDRVTTLRGIAALMVAVGHSLMVFSVDGISELWRVSFAEAPGVESLTSKALLLVFNGSSAVTLFFVISGFVLGLSLDRGKGGVISSYVGFLLRRAFRIYPALIVSLLIVGAVMPWIINIDKVLIGSEWFNSMYREPFEIADVWDNVLLVRTDMNPVSWTLKIELLAALVLPALHLFTRKTGPYYDVAVLVGLTWFSGNYAHGDILKWISPFYFGLIMPRWGGWIERLVSTCPLGASASIGFAIVTFLVAPSNGYAAVSASVLIACLVYGPELWWFYWIDLRWLRSIGHVSYSFYLIHLIVLYCMARAVMRFPDAWLAAISPLVLNILLAGLSCWVAIVMARFLFLWVETPFMHLGKQISQRLGGLVSVEDGYRSKAGVG